MRVFKKVLDRGQGAFPVALSLALLLGFMPVLLHIFLNELALIFHECVGHGLDYCLSALQREVLLLFAVPLLLVPMMFLWTVIQVLLSPPVTKVKRVERGRLTSISLYTVVTSLFVSGFSYAVYLLFPGFLEDWMTLRSLSDFEEFPLYSNLFIVVIVIGGVLSVVSLVVPAVRLPRAEDQSSEGQNRRND